jgi:hypothetical protein
MELHENANEGSQFDNIGDHLYKRIIKRGYVDKPSQIGKKSKKGG